MVSTNLIGGLCNNLFQISMCISYALKYNLPYCIPTEITFPHLQNQKVFYSKFLNYCDNKKDLPIYLEREFTYEKIPYMGNVCFQGYWQSEKYFKEYKEQVINILDVPYEFKKGWCSIHIRRGDYVYNPTMHPTVSMEYIEDAQIYMMNKGIRLFKVYSDDIEYCKKSMPMFNDCTYDFSEGLTDTEDLSDASSCEHNIGCNSSYSWWIYYLNRNENKIGVFPKKENWFGESLPHKVYDLYLPEWILI